MKKIHLRKIQGWLMLCVVGLAACSQAPAPTVAPEEILELAPTPGLEAQAEPYNITIRYNANVPSLVKSAISAARFRWEGVLTQGLPALNATYSGGFCKSDETSTFSGTVDDLLIIVGVEDIDGPEGTIAKSGPCFIRQGSSLPVIGRMIFDRADLANFNVTAIRSTSIHEMAHVLGFGLIWNRKGLVSGTSTANPKFKGANAVREYRALGGRGFVPMELEIEEHWREDSFGNELMTPERAVGLAPLSRLTIAAMQDLGYSVSYSRADAYSLR
jgi:hypothetical protein